MWRNVPPFFQAEKFYLFSGVEKLSTGCDTRSLTIVVKLKYCWLKTCLIQNNNNKINLALVDLTSQNLFISYGFVSLLHIYFEICLELQNEKDNSLFICFI